jgi:hypothetical protein
LHGGVWQRGGVEDGCLRLFGERHVDERTGATDGFQSVEKLIYESCPSGLRRAMCIPFDAFTDDCDMKMT